MIYSEDFFIGDNQMGYSYPPEGSTEFIGINSEVECLRENNSFEAPQDVNNISQINEMNSIQKMEVSLPYLEKCNQIDRDTSHNQLNDLSISEISSKQNESGKEIEKDMEIFTNEPDPAKNGNIFDNTTIKASQKRFSIKQKNLNYIRKMGERNILNISKELKTNQKQSNEKFQNIFSHYNKIYSEILENIAKITGIKRQFYEPNLFHEKWNKYGKDFSLSIKFFKSRTKKGKTIKAIKNIGHK